MTSSLQKYARCGPHLEHVGRVELAAGGQFVVHNDHAFVSARYGGSYALSVVDLTDPSNPTLSETLRFKSSIASVAVAGDVLLAVESGRALNFINVKDPQNLDYFDCGLALGQNLYDVAILGDYAVLAMNWDGVGLMDISDMSNATWVDTFKTEDGFVERLIVARGHIFAACASGGLRVFDAADGELVETFIYADDDFNAGRVFDVNGEVWVFGNGDNGNELLVIDPAAPTEILRRVEFDEQPSAIVALEGGRAVGFCGYEATGFDPANNWSGTLFEMYENDENDQYHESLADTSQLTEEEQETFWDVSRSCMDDVTDVRAHGEHLVAIQGSQLNVYRFAADSVFARER